MCPSQKPGLPVEYRHERKAANLRPLTVARASSSVYLLLAVSGWQMATSIACATVGERRTSGEQKYYLSNLPADTPLKTLAAAIKARWICEQAHQQLKEELGLDHFEGRSWTGLHRHCLMAMIAFAFLQSRRLKAAGRKKKSHRAAATTEHASHQASHPRPLHSTATHALSTL